jgi:hypothetical protein
MWNIHDAQHFFATLQFDHPHLIWWAIPGAIATAALWYLWWRTRRSDVNEWGTMRLVMRYTKLMPTWAGVLLGSFLVLSVVFGFGAATMPFQPMETNQVPAGSLHVVAEVDSSISMGAEDNRIDQQLFGGVNCRFVETACGRRIDIAKLILLNQIMPALQGPRTGVVAGNPLGIGIYSGAGVVRSFLNDDFPPLEKILTTWKWVDIGAALGRGSFVDLGLLDAVRVLEHDKPKEGQVVQNVILLFTDGGSDSSDEDLAKAAEEVKRIKAHLVIILIGKPAAKNGVTACDGQDTTCGSPIPLYDDETDKPVFEKDGHRGYFKVDDKVVFTARDDAFVNKLASMTAGTVVKVTPGEPVAINWPAAMLGSKAEVGKHYYYEYPLAVAILFLSLAWLAPWWVRLLTGGSTASPTPSSTEDRRLK